MSSLFQRINEDIRKPFDDWVSTRYEQKGLKAGRIPTYLIYTPKGKE
jgi:tRNA (guanine-N7-)-methyltransferase